jgi:hypothetical protein
MEGLCGRANRRVCKTKKPKYNASMMVIMGTHPHEPETAQTYSLPTRG